MVPAFTTVVPCDAPVVTPVTDRVWPASGSESFASTDTVTGVPLNVDASSCAATGGLLQVGSFAAFTVTEENAVTVKGPPFATVVSSTILMPTLYVPTASPEK